MQIGKSRTSEDLCRFWKKQEWKFKRPHETLPCKELCFQFSRQVIWRRRPKTTKNWRNWA